MAAIATPTSTYRLQISAAFTLDDARGVLGYLRGLGVDWVYLSPVLAAVPGSTHGYNVVDHSRVDPERGGNAAFEAFCADAHAHGLRVLLDIVPNHVGVERPECNPWWWSVLREGQASPFAQYFDIDWVFGGGKLRIPVLGETIAEATASGALWVDGERLHYFDHVYPIASGTADDGADATTVLGRQHYELMHWSRADHELNYRRFFAVNELAAIRVEDPEVFAASHALVLRWLSEGLIDGLRVDHPDGLANPTAYLTQLAAAMDGKYLLVEKILERGEVLPPFWATHGTTGYDVLAEVDRVFSNPIAEDALRAIDAGTTDNGTTSISTHQAWPDLIHTTKRMIADGILGSEVARLVRDYRAADGASDPADDATLVDAMAELLTCFPVYRSYLPYGREHLDEAVDAAVVRRPDLRGALGRLAEAIADPRNAVAVRFQQTSGMVMAKGVEDTAFYRTGVLASLTEVGGDPSQFAITPDEFHLAQQRRLSEWPHAMTTLSTHDTKRGEDTRARITAISHNPDAWRQFLARRRAQHPLDDLSFENLLWQSIVGSWPRERAALHGYAEKASREAGVRTTWYVPNTEFEARMHALVDALFDDQVVAADVADMVATLRGDGWRISLGAKLLQVTGPGAPDVYQGSELWEFSLVDPDNRRPVDFANGARLLAEIDDGWMPQVDATGAVKLLVTSRALRLRRDRPELFTEYRIVPIISTTNAGALDAPRNAGHASERFMAVDRGGAIVIATRLGGGYAPATTQRDSADAASAPCILLTAGTYQDVFTSRIFAVADQQLLPLADILTTYPVALLAKEPA